MNYNVIYSDAENGEIIKNVSFTNKKEARRIIEQE